MSQDQRDSKFNILRKLFMPGSKTVKANSKTAAAKKKKPAATKKASKTKTTKVAAKASKATAAKKTSAKKTGKVAKKATPAVAKKKDKVAKKDVKVSKKAAAPKKELKKEPKKTKAPSAGTSSVEKKSTAKKASKKSTAKDSKNSSEAKVITESLAKSVVETKPKVSEVLLTDAEGRVLCRFTGCDSPAVVEAYCRYHYLLNWKKIQLRKKILAEGKLENYINELTSRYPDKYLEMMKGDLKTEKDFLAAVQELEIDDPDAAMSDSDAENYLEEVRGIRGDNRGSSEDDY